MNIFAHSKFALAAAALALSVLPGCVGYVEGPPRGTVYVAPPPARVETVVVEDDYVYYPSHQVYYSSSRHHYIYMEGRSWVTRPSPPRVSVGVLFASPSVRLDFHDSPAAHHSTVVRQYPRHWSPQGQSRGNQGRGRRD